MKKIIIYLLLFVSVAVNAQIGTFKFFRVQNSGGSTLIAPSNLPTTLFVYASGSVTLANDYSINITSLPSEGTRFRVYYSLTSVDRNGHDIIIMGNTLTNIQIATLGYYDFTVVKDHTGTPILWPTQAPFDFNSSEIILGLTIKAGSLPLDRLATAIPRSAIDTTGRGRVWVGDGSNATSTLYAAGSGKVLLGDGSDLTSVAVTGDIGISSAGVTSIASGAIVNADVNASAGIARSKLAAGTASQVVVNDGAGVLTSEATLNPLRGGLGADVSSSTGFVTFSAGSSTVGALLDSKTFTVSFETGEQCNNRFKMPFAGTVNGVYAVCTKAIAGTDAGTIVLKNAAGTTMTDGTVTFVASDPLETAYTVTPSANNSFAAGDILYAVTSKTTAGGKVLLTITYNRVN